MAAIDGEPPVRFWAGLPRKMPKATMRSHVEFQCAALLDADAPDSEARGESAARFLADKLTQSGYEITNVGPEDWGWRVSLENDAFPLWIGCGHYKEYRDGLLCFIEPSKPYVRRWLKRIATIEVTEPLAAMIDRVLRANSEVSGIRWWTEANPNLVKAERPQTGNTHSAIYDR